MSDWILLAIGIVLTFGTGVFVAAEFSLVALDKHELERRRDGGERGLDRVIRVSRRLRRTFPVRSSGSRSRRCSQASRSSLR